MDNISLLKQGHLVTVAVPEEQQALRIDHFLALTFPTYSRTFFKRLIEQGCITVNQAPATKASTPVRKHDVIGITVPTRPSPSILDTAHEGLGVRVLFEHEHFLVVEKPSGLPVHKPRDTYQGVTLVDWLVNSYKEVIQVGTTERPGIVHRLDKDTSGLLLIGRTPYGHARLGELFKQRLVEKTYLALVEGLPPAQGVIDFKIERDLQQPTKMKYTLSSGRDALTYYTVREYFARHALLEVRPVTGRTHQIRLHCTAIGHSLVGDSLYGTKVSPASPIELSHAALHAHRLAFTFAEQRYEFCSELPSDLQKAVQILRSAS
jgi:23S rRNA pseudouridine1911/1915/1917 synthase